MANWHTSSAVLRPACYINWSKGGLLRLSEALRQGVPSGHRAYANHRVRMAWDFERHDLANQRAVRSKALTWLRSFAVGCVDRIFLCHVYYTSEARYTLPMDGFCTTHVSPTWHTALTPHRPRRHYPLRHPVNC